MFKRGSAVAALVCAMALGAQQGASASEPVPAVTAVPLTEHRTVVIQVPAGTEPGDPIVGAAVEAAAGQQPAPAAAPASRVPATQTEGS